MNTDVERELVEFLRTERGEAGMRAELRALSLTINDHTKALMKEIHEHEKRDVERFGQILGRLDNHDHRLEELEEGAEVTGVQNVQELRDRYRSLRAQQKESRRFWRGWMMGIVAAVLGGLVSLGAQKLAGDNDNEKADTTVHHHSARSEVARGAQGAGGGQAAQSAQAAQAANAPAGVR